MWVCLIFMGHQKYMLNSSQIILDTCEFIFRKRNISEVLDEEEVSVSSNIGPSEKLSSLDYHTLYLQELAKNSALRKKNESLRKAKNRFQTIVEDLKTQTKEMEDLIDKKLGEMFGQGSLMYNMAINLDKTPRSRRYSLVEKNFAIALYLSSPKAYRIFRDHFPAPTPKTIRHWLEEFDLASGFNEAIFEGLRAMGEKMEKKDRIVTLSFDSTIVNEYFSYHAKSDRVDGLVDKINFEDDNETSEELLSEDNDDQLANSVLVFMIKGINVDYKEPLGYFFHRNALSAENQMKLIKQAIQKLEQCGFTTKCLCCDQATTNVKMYTDLGVTKKKTVCNYQ